MDDTARIGGLLAAALLVWLGTRLQAWRERLGRRVAGARHRRHGLDAERQAETLLGEAGFRIRARQARAGYTLWVEGREHAVEVCADFLVDDRTAAWVAEVKSGGQGTRVGFRGTRRQLLEYQLAFGVQGVVLVDAERRRLHRLRFPFPHRTSAPTRSWVPRLLWATLGAALAALALLH